MKTVYKPPGIPVFPPHADPGGDCVLARLLAEEPGRVHLPWPEGFDAGIAHRLDWSTSGAVVVADDPAELDRIRALFEGKQLLKSYRLLASRDVPWSENSCDAPIANGPRRRGRMVVQRGRNTPHRGRWYPAETSFRRLQGRLWEATMRTGVMHQIRAHAGFVGIAILGDRKYGGGRTPDDAPEGLSFYLHHVGLQGPGLVTDPVPTPAWARVSRA